MSTTPRWVEQFEELQDYVGQLHEVWAKYDNDHHKSSEGAISIVFDPWVSHYDTEEWKTAQPRCEVYSYIFGPHRNHDFKTIPLAILAVKKWAREYSRWLKEDMDIEWKLKERR